MARKAGGKSGGKGGDKKTGGKKSGGKSGEKKGGGKVRKGKQNAKTRKTGKKPAKRRSSRELVNHRYMQALSKPQRVQILAIFYERVASPKEISDELNEGLSQVSYHVNVLRKCRLIVKDHEVPRRGAVEHFYRAATPTLIPPDAWAHLPPAMRKGISMNVLQEFFDDALDSIEAGVFDDAPGELSWTPLILDAPGVEEFGQLARGFLESVLDLQASANKRLAKCKDKATVTSATIFLAAFLSARDPDDDKKASATKRR